MPPHWLSTVKDILIGVVGNFIAMFMCWLVKRLELQKKIWHQSTRLIESLYIAGIKVLIVVIKVLVAVSDVSSTAIVAVEDHIRDIAGLVWRNYKLFTKLQGQRLNEYAASYAYYRRQLHQRSVLLLQGGIRSFEQYLSLLLFDLLSGYGYKPWRGIIAYLIVIVGFATGYYILGPTIRLPLTPLGAIIVSITSFHGRGFSLAENIGLSSPLAILTTAEASVGVIIEFSFIAAFTQRYFGN